MRASRLVLAAAAVAVLAVAGAACGSGGATPSSAFTVVPIGPTPWPNGTVGQYGLRIEPKLLERLPIALSGIAMTEDTQSEALQMDDTAMSDVASMAAAKYGDITSGGLQVWIVRFKPDRQNGDVYGQWIDNYAAGACSQANGIADVSQETINNWIVDVTTCNGGVNAYSLAIGEGEYISMMGLGPKDLGKLLIAQLH